jgi:Ca2+-binding EF-hand superfamily protein
LTELGEDVSSTELESMIREADTGGRGAISLADFTKVMQEEI